MITLTPTTPNPATAEYLHTEATFPCIKSYGLSPENCCFGDCEISLPAFADIDDSTNARGNDFRKFAFKLPTDAGMTATLIRLSDDSEYTIDDTTYGFFADVGDLADEPLVWAFLIKWDNVANELGYGRFRINFIIADGDVEYFNENTVCFDLKPYSCDNAHDTVRFQTLQNGYVQNGFDWRNFKGIAGFFKLQQIRVYGNVSKTPITVTDYLSDVDYSDSQVQKQTYNEYSVNTRFISRETYDFLLKDMLLENPIIMNSYDVYKPYSEVKVTFSGAELEEQVRSRQDSMVINVVDYNKGTIKRY